MSPSFLVLALVANALALIFLVLLIQRIRVKKDHRKSFFFQE